MGKLYLLVSDDKYRLPLIVADSPKELARLAGVSKSTVCTALWRCQKGERINSRYEVVEIDEGEDE